MFFRWCLVGGCSSLQWSGGLHGHDVLWYFDTLDTPSFGREQEVTIDFWRDFAFPEIWTYLGQNTSGEEDCT